MWLSRKPYCAAFTSLPFCILTINCSLVIFCVSQSRTLKQWHKTIWLQVNNATIRNYAQLYATDPSWPHMTSHDQTWPHLTYYDPLGPQKTPFRHFMILLRSTQVQSLTPFDQMWQPMIPYDSNWHHLISHDPKWPQMTPMTSEDLLWPIKTPVAYNCILLASGSKTRSFTLILSQLRIVAYQLSSVAYYLASGSRN